MNGFNALLHHALVVGVKRHVGVYVTVAGVHMQSDENAASQNAGMNDVNFGTNFFKSVARKNLKELGTHFLFPGHAHRSIVDKIKDRFVAIFAKDGCRQRDAQIDQCFGVFTDLGVKMVTQKLQRERTASMSLRAWGTVASKSSSLGTPAVRVGFPSEM